MKIELRVDHSNEIEEEDKDCRSLLRRNPTSLKFPSNAAEIAGTGKMN